jgi:uncharacterized protein YaaW (UPF0174 family)
MSDKSNENLEEFLFRSPDTLVHSLAHLAGDRLGFNGLRKRVSSAEDVPQAEDERLELIREIVKEIRYFGSNNFAYLGRWVAGRERGVSYHMIVYDVSRALNRNLKKKVAIPRVASVEDRERMICGQLLGIMFEGKDEVQIATMLDEAGLGGDAAKPAAIKAAAQAGAGSLLLALMKLFGKKAVKEILSAIAYKIIAEKIGKEAAEQLMKVIIKKIPQKTFSRLLGWVGALLILKDFVDLASPGLRVTIPAVALIAALRQSETLNEVKSNTRQKNKSKLKVVP